MTAPPRHAKPSVNLIVPKDTDSCSDGEAKGQKESDFFEVNIGNDGGDLVRGDGADAVGQHAADEGDDRPEVDPEARGSGDVAPQVAAALPPPPAPVAPRIPRAVRAGSSVVASSFDRGVAEEVVRLPCGSQIRFYEKGARFQATCGLHINCVLTRTGKASKLASRRGQGKPLGLLMAWLLAAPKFKRRCDGLHNDPLFVVGLAKELRKAGRARLLQIERGPQMLQKERKKFTDDSDSEPDVVP